MMSRTLLALSLLFLGACSSSDGAAAGPQIEPAKTTIEIVGDDTLDAALAAMRGKGQLVNFWAMWCAPCVAELPELLEVADAYRAQGGKIVGISYDLMVAGSDPQTIDADLRAFLDARGLAFPVLVYDEDDYGGINQRFALPGEVPVTLAIDALGNIVDRQDGPAHKERFEEMMRKALGL